MRIRVRVISRASKNAVQKRGEDEYAVRLTKAPVDGQANDQMKKVLAEYFSVAPSLIRILRGRTSRTKTVEIPDYAP